jgi:hypothetical protein
MWNMHRTVVIMGVYVGVQTSQKGTNNNKHSILFLGQKGKGRASKGSKGTAVCCLS